MGNADLAHNFEDIDPDSDEVDYVINRGGFYGGRRDFIIQPGDSGKAEGYPVNSARQT